jgi:hypothetical protein
MKDRVRADGWLVRRQGWQPVKEVSEKGRRR